MIIDKYDLIEWAQQLISEANKGEAKLVEARQKVAKRSRTIELQSTRANQQKMMNVLIVQREQLRFAEKNQHLYLMKLKELKSYFQRHWFRTETFIEENEITNKASFSKFVNRSIRQENHAHFKAYDEHRKKLLEGNEQNVQKV